jgi:hypothetical protein
MPHVTFGPHDVAAVLAYLKSIQTHQTAAIATEPPVL